MLYLSDRALQREHRPRGALSALFLLSYFSGRIVVEFWKLPQEGELELALNMGQLLSIPFVALGAWLLLTSFKARARAGWLLPA